MAMTRVTERPTVPLTLCTSVVWPDGPIWMLKMTHALGLFNPRYSAHIVNICLGTLEKAVKWWEDNKTL